MVSLAGFLRNLYLPSFVRVKYMDVTMYFKNMDR